jgi:hypothetical protein
MRCPKSEGRGIEDACVYGGQSRRTSATTAPPTNTTPIRIPTIRQFIALVPPGTFATLATYSTCGPSTVKVGRRISNDWKHAANRGVCVVSPRGGA